MRKKVLLTFLGLLLVSTATATTITNEEVTVDLENSSVNVQMDVETLTTETFNYQTSHPVRNLEMEIDGEEADCEVEQLAVGATINCETSKVNNFIVNMVYETDNLVDSQERINVFRYSQSIYRPIGNYSFKVILPEGTGVVDQENATTDVIVPDNGEVGNMGGRRFFVEWNTQPSLGETQSFRVLYEPFEETPGGQILIPGSVAAAVLVLALTYFIYRRKNAVNSSSILEELGEDERLVVEMLQDAEGEMLQKDIVADSDYSKAKISGVVSTLVDEEIVTKEKEGRSNKVSLREKFLA